MRVASVRGVTLFLRSFLREGQHDMLRSSRLAPLRSFALLAALAIALLASGLAGAAPRAPKPADEQELLGLGFKVLTAQTKVQSDWIRTCTPNQIRAMQRTGKKFFIYPDAANDRVFVGGPIQYEAYLKRHPEDQDRMQKAAAEASAYRAKQSKMMKEATARDESDPFLGSGISWTDVFGG
jgi:hypothetical protein